MYAQNTTGKLQSRGFTAFELVTTERKYVADLKLCLEVFRDPLLKRENESSAAARSRISTPTSWFGKKKEKRSFSGTKEFCDIFSEFDKLIGFNSQLLSALEDALPNGIDSADALSALDDASLTAVCAEMADVFVKFGPFLLLYQAYAQRYERATQNLQRLCANNKELAKWLFEQSDKCRGEDVQSFLIRPVQRLMRYKLLLRDLIKKTDREHGDYDLLKTAIEKLQVVAMKVNEATGHHTAKEKLERSQGLRKQQSFRKIMSNRRLLASGTKATKPSTPKTKVSPRVNARKAVMRRATYDAVTGEVVSIALDDGTLLTIDGIRDAQRRVEEEERRVALLLKSCGRDCWMPDDASDVCPFCEKEWDGFNRRHHCRACGALVCAECSTQRAGVMGYAMPERVCDICFEKAKKLKAKLDETGAGEHVKDVGKKEHDIPEHTDDGEGDAPTSVSDGRGGDDTMGAATKGNGGERETIDSGVQISSRQQEEEEQEQETKNTSRSPRCSDTASSLSSAALHHDEVEASKDDSNVYEISSISSGSRLLCRSDPKGDQPIDQQQQKEEEEKGDNEEGRRRQEKEDVGTRTSSGRGSSDFHALLAPDGAPTLLQPSPDPHGGKEQIRYSRYSRASVLDKGVPSDNRRYSQEKKRPMLIESEPTNAANLQQLLVDAATRMKKELFTPPSNATGSSNTTAAPLDPSSLSSSSSSSRLLVDPPGKLFTSSSNLLSFEDTTKTNDGDRRSSNGSEMMQKSNSISSKAQNDRDGSVNDAKEERDGSGSDETQEQKEASDAGEGRRKTVYELEYEAWKAAAMERKRVESLHAQHRHKQGDDQEDEAAVAIAGASSVEETPLDRASLKAEEIHDQDVLPTSETTAQITSAHADTEEESEECVTGEKDPEGPSTHLQDIEFKAARESLAQKATTKEDHNKEEKEDAKEKENVVHVPTGGGVRSVERMSSSSNASSLSRSASVSSTQSEAVASPAIYNEEKETEEDKGAENGANPLASMRSSARMSTSTTNSSSYSSVAAEGGGGAKEEKEEEKCSSRATDNAVSSQCPLPSTSVTIPAGYIHSGDDVRKGAKAQYRSSSGSSHSVARRPMTSPAPPLHDAPLPLSPPPPLPSSAYVPPPTSTSATSSALLSRGARLSRSASGTSQSETRAGQVDTGRGESVARRSTRKCATRMSNGSIESATRSQMQSGDSAEEKKSIEMTGEDMTGQYKRESNTTTRTSGHCHEDESRRGSRTSHRSSGCMPLQDNNNGSRTSHRSSGCMPIQDNNIGSRTSHRSSGSILQDNNSNSISNIQDALTTTDVVSTRRPTHVHGAAIASMVQDHHYRQEHPRRYSVEDKELQSSEGPAASQSYYPGGDDDNEVAYVTNERTEDEEKVITPGLEGDTRRSSGVSVDGAAEDRRRFSGMTARSIDDAIRRLSNISGAVSVTSSSMRSSSRRISGTSNRVDDEDNACDSHSIRSRYSHVSASSSARPSLSIRHSMGSGLDIQGDEDERRRSSTTTSTTIASRRPTTSVTDATSRMSRYSEVSIHSVRPSVVSTSRSSLCSETGAAESHGHALINAPGSDDAIDQEGNGDAGDVSASWILLILLLLLS